MNVIFLNQWWQLERFESDATDVVKLEIWDDRNVYLTAIGKFDLF